MALDLCFPSEATFVSGRDSLTVVQLLHEEQIELPLAGRYRTREGGYPRVFSRDAIISLLLEEDWDKLRQVLFFCASQQGRRLHHHTGEEPGKIPHEIPGVNIEGRGGRNTFFNACDTAALFLIACEAYLRNTDHVERMIRLVPAMFWSWGYLRAHLRDGLFLEDPRFSHILADPLTIRNADFALRATYWRDGGIPGRKDRLLAYPAAFLLVQAQVIAAFRAVLKFAQYDWFPVEMRQIEGDLLSARAAFREYFGGDPLVVARDRKGPVQFTATDAAHALYFLDPDDVPDSYRDRCGELLDTLETPWGWKTWKFDPRIPGMNFCGEPERIWPWEHACIAEGFIRHGSTAPLAGVARPAVFLADSDDPFSEFISLIDGKPIPDGCQIQRWTIAYWTWLKRRFSNSEQLQI